MEVDRLWLLLQPMYLWFSVAFSAVAAVAAVGIAEQHTAHLIKNDYVEQKNRTMCTDWIELKFNIINYVSYKTANKFFSTVKHT